MPDGRGSRFALEALFFAGLTAGVTLAKLGAPAIVGVMILGWVIVAAIEWALWRSEPHYGAGMPPRYYVPQVSLPPPQPLDLVTPLAVDAQRDEAPTWIASAALRNEMLGEAGLVEAQIGEETIGNWPVAARVPADELELPLSLPPVTLPPLPEEPVVEAAPAPAPEPAPEPEHEHVVLAAPEPVALPEPVAEHEPTPLVEPEPVVETEPQTGEEAAIAPEVTPVLARYTLDPLADAPQRRRLRRGSSEEPPSIQVYARPIGVRALPGRSNRQD